MVRCCAGCMQARMSFSLQFIIRIKEILQAHLHQQGHFFAS